MMKSNILNLFGLGKLPFSASTASILALLLYLAVCRLNFYSTIINCLLFAAVLGLCLIYTEKNKSYAESDAREIVIDEFLGMYICLLIANVSSIKITLILFVIFRILDLFKIPPFSTIDRKLKGKYAFLADDLLIGICVGFGYILYARINWETIF